MKRIIILLIFLTSAIACKDLEKYEPQKNDSEEKTTELHRQNYVTRSGITLGKIDTNYIFQGDMILSKKQVAALDNVEVTRGAINTIPKRFWPCIIPYEYEHGFDPTNVLKAMDTLSRYVGITFVHEEGTNKAHIYFIYSPDNVNYGTYGRENIRNVIHLSKHHSYLTAIHEICHTLGMYHEQCRSDRDNYVDILWNNIDPNFAYAFDKYIDRGQMGVDAGTFDYESIMIYNSYNFGLDIDGKKQPTMLKKDGSLIYSATKLSQGDINSLRQIYGPPYTRLIVETVDSVLEGLYAKVHKEVYVKFYKDKAHFLPTQLDYDRILTITSGRSEGLRIFDTKIYNVVVKAGSRRYFIGDSYYEYDLSRLGMRRKGNFYDVINSHQPSYLFHKDTATFILP